MQRMGHKAANQTNSFALVQFSARPSCCIFVGFFFYSVGAIFRVVALFVGFFSISHSYFH
jgi:hypothetical protein